MAARNALDRVDDGISEARLVFVFFLFVGREPVQEGGCDGALSRGFGAVEDEVATRCCCRLLSVSFRGFIEMEVCVFTWTSVASARI